MRQILKAGEYVWSGNKTKRELARPGRDCKHFWCWGHIRLDAVERCGESINELPQRAVVKMNEG